jgi:hypothetical protein
MPMTKEELTKIEERYDDEMQKLIDEYGNASSVPGDDQRLASERLRAAYAIYANPEMTIPNVFKSYSIDTRVWPDYVDDSTITTYERRMTRAEKIDATMKWAADRVGDTVTAEDLAKNCNIAYSMAKKLIDDRPDVFRKVKRGSFEIRDPKADREAERLELEKQAAASDEAES